MADRIVEISWQILLDCGPENFTLDRLASEARASKQTIYARFSGKTALLGAVVSSRVDAVSIAMGQLTPEGSAQDAFADLAFRLEVALSQPEAVMLERLLDWLDIHSPEAGTLPGRFAVRDRFHALMTRNLELTSLHWGLTIADSATAADFWLDCLYGHVRAARNTGRQDRKWAETFARYFLRAVSE